MFAAVPLGMPWLDAASSGAVTYVQHNPWSVAVDADSAQREHDAYAGWSAFLDRDQAIAVADHPDRSGELTRWDGLCGYTERTPSLEASMRDWEATMNSPDGLPDRRVADAATEWRRDRPAESCTEPDCPEAD